MQVSRLAAAAVAAISYFYNLNSRAIRLALLSGVASGALGAADLDLGFETDIRKFGAGRAAAVQADGKVIIGGIFEQAHGQPASGVARFESSGALDPSFSVGSALDGSVFAVAVQPDGKVLIGGSFNRYVDAEGGETTTRGIARLNADGSLDSTFATGSGTNGSVLSVVLQGDGKVLIGGSFTTVNGTTRNRIARLNVDGSLDTGFNPGSGADSTVWDIVLQADGKPVISGDFSNFNGSARRAIARLNTSGSLDTGIAFGAAPNGSVYAVELDGQGGFYIGGNFTFVGGTSRNRIARLTSSGALDTGWYPNNGVNGFVADMKTDSAGRLLIAGSFSGYVSNYFNSVHGLVRIANGENDASFVTSASDTRLIRQAYISDIAIAPGDNVIAAGYLYDEDSGQAGMARFNAAGGSVDSFNGREGLEQAAVVRRIVNGRGGKYYVGGDFDWVDDELRMNLVRFSGDARVDPTFVPGASWLTMNYDGSIYAMLEREDGGVWAFGNFTQIADSGGFSSYDREGAVRFNEFGNIQDTSTDPLAVAGGTVTRAIMDSQGRMILSGNFTAINGTNRAGVARVGQDGVVDTTFDPGTGPADGVITDLALDDQDRVYASGNFTSFNGTSEANLVRLDTSGAVDTAFAANTDLNGLVNSVAVLPGGKVIVGGNFTASGGFAANGIDRLNTDGTSDSTFLPGAGADNFVYDAQPDSAGRIVVAGAFQNLRGAARPAGLGRMTADGPLDTLFDDTTIQGGYAFEVLERPDGKLLMRGSFTGFDGESREHLARFHSVPVRRGDLDSSFRGASLATDTVRAVLPTADGGYLMFGEFTQFDRTARNRIAKTDVFGRLDETFHYDRGFNGDVFGARRMADGGILVWGQFSGYDNQPRASVLKLNADGTLDPSFAAPVINSAVKAVDLQEDGKILIGGGFTNVGGVATGGVARLHADGSHDTTFAVSPGTDGDVQAIVVADDGIFVGGRFSAFAGAAAPFVTKLTSSGALASGFETGTGPNGSVNALHVDADGGVWIGGSFTTVNDVEVRGLARLNADGSRDEDFLSGLGIFFGAVEVLAPLADGRVYVGGSFTTLGGGEHNGLARVTAAGRIDPVFDAGEGFNGTIHALNPLPDGRLAVGGTFRTYRGEDRERVAIIYGGDQGTPFIPNDQLFGIEVEPGDPATLTYGELAGGSYQWYKDDELLVGETSAAVQIASADIDDLGVYSLRLSNGGGEFRTVGIRLVVKLAPVVATAPVTTAVGYGASATFSVVVDGPGPFTYQWFRDGVAIDGAVDNTYTVGGVGDDDFGDAFSVQITNAYGAITSSAATLDFDSTAVPGALKLPFDGRLVAEGSNSITTSVSLPDGRHYVGGGQFLHRINADGSIDDTFATNFSSLNVTRMLLQPDGKLIAAGSFVIPGQSSLSIVRFLPSGAIDPTWQAEYIFGSNAVQGMVLQEDGKVVIAGDFRRIGTVDKWNLARLNPDGSLDESYGPADRDSGPYSDVFGMVKSGDGVVIVGDFDQYGGSPLGHMARINANGSLDTSFGGGSRADDVVYGIIPASGGKFYIEGIFRNYGGVARAQVARIHADGSLDTSFDPGKGPQTSSSRNTARIQGMAEEADGALVLVGSFQGFNDWPAINSVRLTPTGAVDTQWATPTSGMNFSSLTQLGDGRLIVGGSFDLDGDNQTTADRAAELLSGDYPPQAPAITTQSTLPATAVYRAGSFREFSALVSGRGELSLQWYRDGVPVEESDTVVGATTAALELRSLRTAEAGDYVLRITSPLDGFTESDPITLQVGAESTGPGSLDLTWSGGTGNVVGLGEDGSFFRVESGGFRAPNRLVKYGADGIVLPDSVFNTGTGITGVITGAIQQPDGKVIIWGTITEVQGVARSKIARLNANGSLDTGFNPSPDFGVSGVYLQPDGKILVWGQFDNIAGTAREAIARLNSNGSFDGGFSNSFGYNEVFRVAPASGGDFYVVGTRFSEFTHELIRINSNGSVDGGFSPVAAPNGSIQAIAVDSANRPVVGGSFTSIANTPRNRLARFSSGGQLDQSFGPVKSEGPNSTVSGMYFAPDGFLYVTGNFSVYDGFALGSLVRLDANGQIDLNFPADGLERVRSVSSPLFAWSDTGKLVFGGTYSYSPRNGVVRFNVDGAPTGPLNVVDSSGDRIVVEGVDLSLYARVEGGGPVTYAWQREGVTIPGAIGPQLLLDSPTLDQGGTYTLTATNGLGSVSVDLEVGFLTADPLSPTPGYSLSTGFNNSVRDVVIRADGSRVVAGSFTQVEGVNQQGIAAITAAGSLDTSFRDNLPFHPTYGTSVSRVIEEPNGSLLLLGNMYFPGTDPAFKRHFLVRLNANGALAQILLDQDDMNSGPSDMALLPDGKILIVHSRSDIGGVPVDRLTRLNANGSVDTSFLPNGMEGWAYHIKADGDGRYLVSGRFTAYDGVALDENLIRIDANGTRDFSFDAPTFDQTVQDFAFAADGDIYARGNFNAIDRINGKPVHVVRLSSTGKLDPTFVSPVTSITSMVLDPLGRLVVAGSIPGFSGSRLVRLLNNGAVDRAVAITQAVDYLGLEGDQIVLGSRNGAQVNGISIPGISLINPGAAEDFALVTQSESREVIPGTSTSIGVGVRGGGAATYQWYLDGEALAGANSPGLVFDGFTAEDAGRYTLEITTGGETLTADPVDLSVRTNRMLPGQIDLNYGVGLATDALTGFGEDAAGRAYLFGWREGPASPTKIMVGLDENGQVRPDFNLDPRISGGPVRDMHGLPDGKLLIVGQSLRYDAVNTSVIRLNADGSLDESFDSTPFTGTAQRIEPLPDGRFLLAGSSIRYVDNVWLNFGVFTADGVFDEAFNSMSGASVSDIAPAADGKWWVIGSWRPETTFYVVWRINADGSWDDSFPRMATRSRESIAAIAGTGDGGVYLMRRSSFDNMPVDVRIVKLNAQGEIDPTFQAGEFRHENPASDVSLVSMQTDAEGRLLVSGNFATYDGLPRYPVVRLLPDGSADPAWVGAAEASAAGYRAPNHMLVPTNGTRLLVWSQQLTGLEGVLDRTGIYALHYGELAADAAPEPRGIIPAPVVDPYESLSLGVPVLAPADAMVQWFKDGEALPGEDAWSLRRRAVTSVDSGSYFATITTSGGVVTTPNIPVSISSPGYTGALSRNNALINIDSPIEFSTRLSDGRILMVARYGALVNDAGPYELFFINADGTFGGGLPTRFEGSSDYRRIMAADVDDQGRLYVGGSFSLVNDSTDHARFVRLLPDGSIDETFDLGTGVNSTVTAIAVDGAGKVIIAGSFSQINGVSTVDGNSVSRLARLNPDGSIDSSFTTGTGPNSTVSRVGFDSTGRILVSGGFSLYNGFEALRFMRLNSDGTLDNTFLPAPNSSSIRFHIQPDDRIFVWGSFSQIFGETRSTAAWINADGTLAEALPVGVANTDALDVAADGTVYWVNGFSTYRVRPDNTEDLDFRNSYVQRGRFLTDNGNNSFVRRVHAVGDQVLLTGDFARVGETDLIGHAWIAPVDDTDPAPLRFTETLENIDTVPGGRALWNAQVASIGEGTVTYTWIKEGAPTNILSTQSSLSLLNVDASDAGTYRVTVSNGAATITALVQLSVGDRIGEGPGYPRLDFFSSITSISDQGLVRLRNGRIVVAQSAGLRRLRPDGSLDESFVTPAPDDNRQITGVKLGDDGMFYVWGNFSSIDGHISPQVARFHPDGSIDTSFVSPMPDNSNVQDLLMAGEAGLYVIWRGNTFLDIGGVSNQGIARLRQDGSVDPSFNPGGGASSIFEALLQPDGKVVVVGSFTTFGTASRRGIVRLNNDGALDPAFNSLDISNVNRVLRLADGRLLVAGGFQTVDGLLRPRVARLDANGFVDQSFGPLELEFNSVYRIALRPDGRILVAGNVGNATRVAQFFANGTLDPSFDNSVVYWRNTTSPSSSIYRMEVMANGDILLQGSFGLINNAVNRTGLNLIQGSPLAPGFYRAPQGPASAAAGDRVVFTADAYGSGNLSYQWRRDGQAISGATSATLEIPSASADDAGDYSVEVTSALGSATSAAASLAVLTPPVITTEPVDASAQEGESVSFTVAYESSSAATVQWTFDGQDIVGATSDTYTIASASAAEVGDYQAIVTNDVGSTPSAIATFTLLGLPEITSQPAGETVDAGADVTLSVEATGIPTPTYQWRLDEVDLVGATEATLSLTSVTRLDAGTYTVVVTNSVGSVTSEGAVVGVNAAPSFSTQPEDLVVEAGDPILLSAEAIGPPMPTFQWFRNNVAIPGATGSTLNITSATPGDDGVYHVVASNRLGDSTSDDAIVSVRYRPVLTTDPVSQTVSRGDSVTFSVIAEGNPAPAYQWRKDGTPLIGATSASLSLTDVQAGDAGAYDVIVSNDLGSVGSATANLTVNVGPVIHTQPVSQTVVSGAQVVFSVSATGGDPLTYQWRKDGSPLAGATATSLTLNDVAEADAGVYDVVVTDPVDAVTSSGATLVVAEIASAHTVAGRGYVAGDTVTINVSLTFGSSVSGLGLAVLLPDDVDGQSWSFVSDTSGAPISPDAGDTRLAEWGWISLPDSPVEFSYTLNVPAGATGDVELTAMVELRAAEMDLQAPVNPDPLIMNEAPATHSADTNGDFALNLSELLRVIELYNTRAGTSRTGRYTVAETATEDGFRSDAVTPAGEAPSFSRFHSADTDRNAEINLSELLRVIELYNYREGTQRTGVYRRAEGTEDGFASGPAGG